MKQKATTHKSLLDTLLLISKPSLASKHKLELTKVNSIHKKIKFQSSQEHLIFNVTIYHVEQVCDVFRSQAEQHDGGSESSSGGVCHSDHERALPWHQVAPSGSSQKAVQQHKLFVKRSVALYQRLRLKTSG